MKKFLVLTILLALIGAVIFFVRTNTDLLTTNIPPEKIAQNNFNQEIDEEITTSDLSELLPQSLTVNGTERALYLPEGFEISVYSSGFDQPRSFDFDEQGNMFVTEKGAGRVMMIMTNGTKKIIDSNLRSIHGIVYHDSDLYVAEEHQVVVYRRIGTDGNFARKEVLIEGLPSGGGHTTRSLAISPDEKLFVSVGSSCNICEEKDERRAAVLRYDLDGSNEELFAEGLRNSVGILIRQNSNGYQLWGVDNGRDRIGDNIPVEEVNIIEKGRHYGWPYCHGSGIPNPEYPDRENYCRHSTEFPTYSMQAHSAPLGLSFVPQGFAPGLDQEDLIIPFHGSWNRTVPTGYKVVRIDTSDPQARTVNFITGWLLESGFDWGRPVDVGFFQRELYISDDKAGVIYKVVQNSNHD